MSTVMDDAIRALFDFLILVECVLAFWFVWVESWMPIYKNYTITNGWNWIFFAAMGVFFIGLFAVIIGVTWGAKQRRYPPPPKPIVVVSPSVATKKPSSDLESQLNDFEERLEALENKKQ